MKKAEALAFFDNSVATAAAEIGISTSAISQWPDELPPRLRDRVHAALWRRQQRTAQVCTVPPDSSEVRSAAA